LPSSDLLTCHTLAELQRGGFRCEMPLGFIYGREILVAAIVRVVGRFYPFRKTWFNAPPSYGWPSDLRHRSNRLRLSQTKEVFV